MTDQDTPDADASPPPQTQKIHEYHVPLESNSPPPFELSMPAGSQAIGVHHLPGIALLLLVRCNPNMPRTLRKFQWLRTGVEIPDNSHRYVGTVFAGDTAFHLFEERA